MKIPRDWTCCSQERGYNYVPITLDRIMDRDKDRIMDRDIDRIMDRDKDRIMDRNIGRKWTKT